MDVAIVGGGICGLSLALNLKERGIACRVYERAPEIKELGVGITLLPHAMREFSALGLGDTLLKAGIENRDCAFFNRFGQLIYREDRGKFAGYPFPEVGIHRGRLHVVLYEAVQQRLGPDAVITDCECTSVEQNETGATILFKQTITGQRRPSVRADIVIATHQSRAAAGFHQHQGRGVGRRQTVRQSRQIHHAG
jgi:5-methylphenazine-1-carboxylate 1-monooxygenase